MTLHSAKESLMREEVIDILRRNVKLYKNEPEFVNYIVDLAIYLLDNTAAREAEAGDADAPGDTPRVKPIANIQLERIGLPPEFEPDPTPKPNPLPPVVPKPLPEPDAQSEAPPAPESRMPRVTVDKGGKTRVYRIFRASTNTVESFHCPICGSETQGNRICPNCGHVL